MRGAFTGAVADRRGRFELADGGTIFLGRIGDMSEDAGQGPARAAAQTMEPVGGTASVRVDARVQRRPTGLQSEIRRSRFRGPPISSV